MKVDDLKLAENLKRLREEIGISQWELYRRSGVTNATISRIEAGIQKNVELTKLVSLCNGLKCSLFDLLYDPTVTPIVNVIKQSIPK